MMNFGSEFLSAPEAPVFGGEPPKWLDWQTGILYYGDEAIETV